MDNREQVREMAKQAIIGVKKYGYVAGIILVAIGVSIFLTPIATSSFMVYLMLGGLLVSGIARIVYYFKLPKDARNGLFLAVGILWLIAACVLIADVFDMPIETTLSIQAILGLFIGFNLIFSGITSICTSGQIKAMGGSSAAVIISGILEIICGAIVLSSPLMGLFAITAAFGICLTVTGIATIVRCIAY